MAGTFLKDPNAVLDYGVDWTLWLGTDSIASSTWSVARSVGVVAPAATAEEPDLAEVAGKPSTNDAKTTRVWVQGGVLGATYDLTNRITTTEGRVDDRTIKVIIKQK